MTSLYFLKHIERQIVRLENHRAGLEEQITCLRQFLRANNVRPKSRSKSRTKTFSGKAETRLLAHMKTVNGVITARGAAQALAIPLGTISARLSKLRQDGVVTNEGQGKWRLERTEKE